jgi:hypothetical protein
VIDLYDCSGRRLDRISDRALSRLQADGQIARIVRRRDGRPMRAYMTARSKSELPGRMSAFVGQRYSYLEALENCRVWALRRLGRGDELRPIFLSVLHSCLVLDGGDGGPH